MFYKVLTSWLFFLSFSTGIFSQVLDTADTSTYSSDDLVCPLSDLTPEKRAIKSDTEDDYVDLNRPVKDVLTELVVTDFTTKPQSLFAFFKLINETVSSAIEAYKTENNLNDSAITFLFKGGNVLRIIANGILSQLPDKPKELLEKAYKDYFKRSDLDFTIIIDEEKLNGLDYDQVMSNMMNLAYESLDKIRMELTKNPKIYFDFFALPEEAVREKLDKYLAKLNSLEAIKDPENKNLYKAKFLQLQVGGYRAKAEPECKYEGQFDYRYDFTSNKKDEIAGTPLTKNPHWIMNTINTSLEWPTTTGKGLVKFNLVRAKIEFEVTDKKPVTPESDVKAAEDKTIVERKPVGGEGIDISLPDRQDFRIRDFIENMATFVAQFHLTLDGTDQRLNFKAESFEGIADDLKGVLFDQNSRTWEGAKSDKRLHRLFFLGWSELMGTMGIGSARAKEYYYDVTSKIIEPAANLYPMSSAEDTKTKVEVLNKSITEIQEKYPELGVVNLIWRSFGNMIANELVKNPKDDDEKNFKDLLALIETNMNILWQLTDMDNFTIDFSKIYDAKMSSFF